MFSSVYAPACADTLLVTDLRGRWVDDAANVYDIRLTLDHNLREQSNSGNNTSQRATEPTCGIVRFGKISGIASSKGS
jgi:hypothetical protein